MIPAAFTSRWAEAPQGVVPTAERPDHPVLAGLPATWPGLLGYNRVTPKPADPPEFMDWPGYAPLCVNLVTWLARQA
jgi:uncharacterized membrane protein